MADSTLRCYNNGIDTEVMPNTHLEHLEDLVFTSRRSLTAAVWNAVNAPRLSIKWDGAPAIVFGTNPENGKFFVGTKSVFNKVRVKICYDNNDIDRFYQGTVADILRLCLSNLPRVGGIVQADWIGVGGGSVYTPNTVSYTFPNSINHRIILAPHTTYEEISPNATATVGYNMCSDCGAYFLNEADSRATVKRLPFNWFRFMRILPFVKVPSAKARPFIMKHVNKFIRCGSIPSAEVMYVTLDDKYKGEVNVTTFVVWQLIFQLKQRLLDAINVDGGVKCSINGSPVKHEGFVAITDNPYKIVDRLTFSKANFNLSKNWTNEKV